MITWLLACTPEPTNIDDTDVPTAVPTAVATVEDTDVVDTDVPTPPPTEPSYQPIQEQCDTLPPLPDTFVNLAGQGPHEDFAFDDQGNLVGVDGVGNLRAKPRQGDAFLISPAVGAAKGTRFTPDGGVVIAVPEDGTIVRVEPDGAKSVLANVQNANGVAIDLDGNAWVATGNGTVERIAPDGERTVVVDIQATLDGIAFSPDYRTLYFNSEFGGVRYIELDEDGEPVGEQQLLVTLPVSIVAILDGMTTDVCGNLYISRMDGRVYRVLPDGTIDGFINFATQPGLQVVPAVNFGSGLGGFERNRLYAMNFLGGVLEAEIGIDGRWEPHYPVPE